jgi:hypothetical protein
VKTTHDGRLDDRLAELNLLRELSGYALGFRHLDAALRLVCLEALVERASRAAGRPDKNRLLKRLRGDCIQIRAERVPHVSSRENCVGRRLRRLGFIAPRCVHAAVARRPSHHFVTNVRFPPASALRCVSLSNNRQAQGEASGRRHMQTLSPGIRADVDEGQTLGGLLQAPPARLAGHLLRGEPRTSARRNGAQNARSAAAPRKGFDERAELVWSGKLIEAGDGGRRHPGKLRGRHRLHVRI